MGYTVIADEKGRVVILKEVREELNIKKGSSLILEVKDGIIVLKVRKPSPMGIYGIAEEEEVDIEEIEGALGYEDIH
ncbi:AbrB family transcriptional regulator [Candidatus Acidianus copahuensis]|uniref:AbrB family transcriptional regulator n=1 Tax=Candidatus Acidianus copahuensis TaxID=1160895 RepID=A0A031LJG5_9CREN|nr:AbrB family transcriptional regulator [Candidatus Acidianus copahuensis]